MPEDHVAARLVIQVIADLLKRADRVRAAADWQRGHTGTSMIASVTGPGTGSPCFSRLWKVALDGIADVRQRFVARRCRPDVTVVW